MYKYKSLYLYALLFLIVELFVFLVLYYQTTLKINSKITLYETRINDNYNILYNLSKDFVDVTAEDILSKEEVISTIQVANLATDNSTLDSQREYLLALLQNKYNAMKKVGITHFHFILKNGDSFARFHDQGKYGDNLLGVRESIKYALENKKAINTFEIGKIYSGYRFIYPIFDKNYNILGALEISYKIDHLTNHFEKNFFNSIFIEDKATLQSKLFDDYKPNYVDFPIHNNFLVSKTNISNLYQTNLIKQISKNLSLQNFDTNIKTKNSFSIYFKDNSEYKIVYFKAITHNTTGSLIGYLVISSKIAEIKDYLSILYVGFFVISFFNLIIFLYLYTLRRTKKELKHILSSEQKLLEKIDKYVIYGKSDLSGNIIEVSQAFCEVCGYSKNELIGKKFKLLRHHDMPKDVFKDLWSTITNGHIWQREVKNMAKDGSSYWVKVTIQPDFDDNGIIESYTAISQNISNRKRIESIYRDLRFQVEQYNAIFNNANSGIGTIDLKGTFLQANNRFIELLNQEIETLVDTNLMIYLDKESQASLGNALKNIKNKPNIHKLQLSFNKASKSKSYIEISLSLLPDQTSLVIVCNPLDDKIKLQKTLEFNKTLLYAIPLPVFIQDKELKLVECNKAFLDFFNLTKEDVLGNKIQNIIGKQLYELIPQELSNLYKYQDDYKIEKNLSMYQTKIKNWLGVERTIEIYKTTYNYKDNFNGIIGVMVDVSNKEEQTNRLQETIVTKTLENIKQTKEFEEERLKSIKFQAIGQLAAGITHEINTPLTFAKGNLEMMLYDIKDLPQNSIKDNLLEISQSIMTGLNRIAMIVESMREMSQQTKEIKEPTNIYSTLLIALTMAHNRAKIITKIYINSQEFEIGMDKNQFIYISNIQKQRIEQVWIVIINNALDELIKIEPFEKRYIDIKLETKDGYNIVYIRDNGGGIPKHLLDTIFQPFVSNKDSSGMGIGLNVAQRIIKDNNGEIMAYNDEFGAVFEVRLPCI